MQKNTKKNNEIDASHHFLRLSCSFRSIKIYLIVHESEIIHLSFSRKKHQDAVEILTAISSENLSAKIINKESLCKKLTEQLSRVFTKPVLPAFNSNPFLSRGTDFQIRIWRLISKIKPGETRTYGEIAEAAGSPGAARAVGRACNTNPLALIIPCHRVVGANSPGGFATTIETKLKLLEMDKEFY